MKKIIERVIEISNQNPDGFTIRIPAMDALTSGYVVAYYETQNNHDLNGLESLIQHAMTHERYVAGWYNPDNGRYYFDSVRVFPADQRDAAIAFGRENKQLSIYNLHDQIVITL